ncbi:hypothetical protein ACIRN5_23645, partial [Lysinibacillus fusiformis]|uniref:hypothetical protein n=2 Tax=Bacillati TaxID=1783272 RepID=UPI0037F5D50D
MTCGLRAFGMWKPNWIKSTFDGNYWNGPNLAARGPFKVDPNLREGRIKRLDGGLLSVQLSGHNLLPILESLRTGSAGEGLANAARCRTLYGKFAAFVALIDPDAP